MATVVTWNGSSFTVPATGEENWGGVTKVDGLLASLATNGFQKTGGLFTLSADADFGASAGLKAIYYKSRGTVSTAGILRLAKTEAIAWRNNADGGNNTLATDTSDQLLYNGTVIASSAGVVPVAAGGTGLSSYTAGDMLYASGTTTLAKLAIGAGNTVQVSTGTAPSWALLANANISGSAAIAYSKLSLTGSIVNADVSASAGIVYSKLSLTGSILNADLAGSIAASKLVGSDIATVGTVTSGTWSATAIAATKGGTGQTSFTTGDLVYASSSSALSKLLIGSTGQVLKVSGGLPAWGSAGASLAVTAKTSNYTIANTDDALTGDATGGAFSFTLPDCATNAGKAFYIKKIDSTLTAITIARAGSDTIQDAGSAGTSTTLNTQGEEILIVGFGSTVWQIVSRRIPSVWASCSMTPNNFGTVSNGAYWVRREGDSACFRGYFTCGTVTGSNATISLPSGYVIDTTKLTSGIKMRLGSFEVPTTSGTPASFTSSRMGAVVWDSSNSDRVQLALQGASGVYSASAASTVASSNDGIGFEFTVPISGWNG